MAARTLARWVQQAGVELVGGLLLLTASAWMFAWTAEQLLDGETHADTRFAAWLHERATPGWTRFFEVVTWCGNLVPLVIVTVLAAAYLASRRQVRELQLLALGFVGVEILTTGLKLGFGRERPFFPDPLATERTYSFPSGHASMSLAVYGTLGFILARHLTDRRARVAVLAAAAAIVLLIGFSRLYLGVHFLSDVVAGFSLALAWMTLCALVLHLRVRLAGRAQTSRYRASTKQ